MMMIRICEYLVLCHFGICCMWLLHDTYMHVIDIASCGGRYSCVSTDIPGDVLLIVVLRFPYMEVCKASATCI
jgi:hypothetical protein